MIHDSQYFTERLLAIYPCKVPFTLVLIHDDPKRKLGTYYSARQRIVIHTGYKLHDPMETAIHEYAHHLHYTEFGKEEKRQEPHGREFWQIYGQLVNRAKILGIYEDKRLPVIIFPETAHQGDAPGANQDRCLPPNLSRALHDVFSSAYGMLNRK